MAAGDHLKPAIRRWWKAAVAKELDKPGRFGWNGHGLNRNGGQGGCRCGAPRSLCAGRDHIQPRALSCRGETGVVNQDRPEVIAKAECGREVKRVQRAQLPRLEARCRFENCVIDGQQSHRVHGFACEIGESSSVPRAGPNRFGSQKPTCDVALPVRQLAAKRRRFVLAQYELHEGRRVYVGEAAGQGSEPFAAELVEHLSAGLALRPPAWLDVGKGCRGERCATLGRQAAEH